MFLLQVVVVVLLAVAGVVLLFLSTQRESIRDAGSRSLAVAEGFARSPEVAESLASRHPTAALQPQVQEAQRRSDVDYVGVLNRDGTYVALASVGYGPGTRTTTDMAPLLAGRTVTEEAVGGLGPQIRAYVPVKGPTGQVVGAVSAGVTLEHVSQRVTAQLPAVLGATVGAV
ncbi:histidine kinase, partial [Streptomyces carpinensis]